MENQERWFCARRSSRVAFFLTGAFIPSRSSMPKCQHCGAGIEGAEITYRDANKGGRRAQSVRLCGRCVDRYDKLEAAKKVRNMVLAIVAVGALIVAAAYLLVHR
jgi:hypothetical protein